MPFLWSAAGRRLFCGRIFQDLVDVLIYGIDLVADGIHGSTLYQPFLKNI